MVLGFPFLSLEVVSTGGTGRREADGGRCKEPHSMGLTAVDAHNFGDDLPSFFHEHHVALTQIQPGHLVGIVQTRFLDCGPSQLHRVQLRHGGDCTCPPHLIANRLQLGANPLRFKFEGDGPSGTLGRHPQALLVVVAVHFDDNAINGKIQPMPGLVPVRHKPHDLFNALGHLQSTAFWGFEPPNLCHCHSFAVALHLRP